MLTRKTLIPDDDIAGLDPGELGLAVLRKHGKPIRLEAQIAQRTRQTKNFK